MERENCRNDFESNNCRNNSGLNRVFIFFEKLVKSEANEKKNFFLILNLAF